jgi:hypothetical protein
MVLLFVVCGWREEAVAGVFLRTTWYFLHTFFWLPGLRYIGYHVALAEFN